MEFEVKHLWASWASLASLASFRGIQVWRQLVLAESNRSEWAEAGLGDFPRPWRLCES